jgi:hypothetical protein
MFRDHTGFYHYLLDAGILRSLISFPLSHFAITGNLTIFMVLMWANYFMAILGMVSLAYCKKEHAPAVSGTPFDSVPASKQLVPSIAEISGIADSKVNPGYIWGEEDSGNPTRIFIIGHDGHVVKSVFLKGTVNRDWEEMAISNSFIYLAETGDNNQVYGSYKFYRFPEPAQSIDTVFQVESIPFSYTDGPHDAEAFLVDPDKKDIYIITKRDNPSRIYKLPYPYTTGIAAYEGELTYPGVVSAAISESGEEIIVKTYGALHYYKRTAGKTITEALQETFINLPYKVEPQGEAVCFAADGSGIYTLSEQTGSAAPQLYYYKRK